MIFDKYNDGLCPECLLADSHQELWLNSGDLFECPKCHLVISLASGMRVTIVRRRGQGNFKSLSDRRYCATGQIRGLLLVREDKDKKYEADGFNVIESAEDLKKYVSEIKDVDEFA